MLVLGHRGCAYYPENTMKAFKQALDFGADGIEIDVQKTLDNVLVISHDENLKRLIGIDLNIRKVNFQKLKGIRIQGEEVPKLENVLEFIKDSDKFIDIEVKNNNDFKEVYNLVKDLRIKDYVISSFWHRDLFGLKLLYEDVKIGFLYVHEPRAIELEMYFKDVDFLKPNYFYVTDEYKTYFRATIPWTVNDIEKAVYFKERDTFGIITDFPDKIIEVLKGGSNNMINPYLSYFLQMIDKETIQKGDNNISFDVVNYIMPINIEEINVEGGEVNIGRELPFLWNIGERLKFELKLQGENPKINIRVREVGDVSFTLKDIQSSLI